ncbi:MAG: hypothetical protein JWN04_6811 [Myxococcaceae bacterium]|nr:hypothetical protein [Myxococcaceae bacterium]
MATGYAALIRGINVGGHNALPMQTLRTLFVEAGCSDVRTYIQSGNVVFQASAKLASSLPKQLGAQIAKHLKREADVSVVVRSAQELDQVIADNPYPQAAEAPKTVHVGFLEQAPSADKVALLSPKQSSTDVFEVRGKQLYLFTPEGYGRSKLTMSFFAKLDTPCTMRNWNTVLKLHSMLETERP